MAKIINFLNNVILDPQKCDRNMVISISDDTNFSWKSSLSKIQEVFISILWIKNNTAHIYFDIEGILKFLIMNMLINCQTELERQPVEKSTCYSSKADGWTPHMTNFSTASYSKKNCQTTTTEKSPFIKSLKTNLHPRNYYFLARVFTGGPMQDVSVCMFEI